MKVFWKQTFRKPWSAIFLILILVLSNVLSCVGISARAAATAQLGLIDEQYTTIAVHSGLNSEAPLGSYSASYFGLDSREYDDGRKYIGPKDALRYARESEYYQGDNTGILLSAHVAGSRALSSGASDVYNYQYEFDRYCYNLTVAAVRCTSVQRENNGGINKTYIVGFDIVDYVCRMDVYDLPPENESMLVYTDLLTREGECPYEVDKTYLIRVDYNDYMIESYPVRVTGEDGIEQVVTEYARRTDVEWNGRYIDFLFGGALDYATSSLGFEAGIPNFKSIQLTDPETQLTYRTMPEDSWPIYAEYEGDWQDFLNGEEGRVWKEEIIPNYEINHASAAVILTNRLESMLNFNTGDASVIEGRAFTTEEYEQGSAVCLVSAAYAKRNGLNVGDVINMDYYDSGYEFLEAQNADLRIGMNVSRYPLTEETRMGICEDYTIVGIYSSPEWTLGAHSFHADTIFVPKASVPGMDEYVQLSPTLPMLSSIVIENGSIDAFEAYMAENDMAEVYVFFDQGYSDALSSVETMIDNSQRMMIVGIATFVLTSMVFLMLYVRKLSPVARTMRLLGISQGKVWIEAAWNLLAQILMAVIFGAGVSIAMFDFVTRQIMNGSLELPVRAVVLCAGVQFAILFASGLLMTWMIARRNLMQRN